MEYHYFVRHRRILPRSEITSKSVCDVVGLVASFILLPHDPIREERLPPRSGLEHRAELHIAVRDRDDEPGPGLEESHIRHDVRVGLCQCGGDGGRTASRDLHRLAVRQGRCDQGCDGRQGIDLRRRQVELDDRLALTFRHRERHVGRRSGTVDLRPADGEGRPWPALRVRDCGARRVKRVCHSGDEPGGPNTVDDDQVVLTDSHLTTETVTHLEHLRKVVRAPNNRLDDLPVREVYILGLKVEGLGDGGDGDDLGHGFSPLLTDPFIPHKPVWRV